MAAVDVDLENLFMQKFGRVLELWIVPRMIYKVIESSYECYLQDGSTNIALSLEGDVIADCLHVKFDIKDTVSTNLPSFYLSCKIETGPETDDEFGRRCCHYVTEGRYLKPPETTAELKDTWPIGRCTLDFANIFLYKTVIYYVAGSILQMLVDGSSTMELEYLTNILDLVAPQLELISSNLVCPFPTTNVQTDLSSAAVFVLHTVDKMLLLHEKHVMDEIRDLTSIPDGRCILSTSMGQFAKGFRMLTSQGITRSIADKLSKINRENCLRFTTILRYLGLINLNTQLFENGPPVSCEMHDMFMTSLLFYKGIDGQLRVDDECNISLSSSSDGSDKHGILMTSREYNICKNHKIPIFFGRDLRFGDKSAKALYNTYETDPEKSGLVRLYGNTVVSKGCLFSTVCRRALYFLGPIVALVLIILGVYWKSKGNSPADGIALVSSSAVSAVWAFLAVAFGDQFRYWLARALHAKYLVRPNTQHRNISSLTKYSCYFQRIGRAAIHHSVFRHADLRPSSLLHLESKIIVQAITNVVRLAYLEYPMQSLFSGNCSYLNDSLRKHDGIEFDQPVALKDLLDTGRFLIYESSGLRICHVKLETSTAAPGFEVLADKLLQKTEGRRNAYKAIDVKHQVEYSQWILNNTLDYLIG